MMGFQPPTCGRPRRVARQQFLGRRLFCVRPGTPGGGLCPAEVRGYGGPLSNTEALAHTILRTRSVLMCSKIVKRFSNALILGGLPPLHRHGPWQERRCVICPRVRGRPTAFARPQVLRAHQNGVAVLGTARASGPFWTTYTTMTHALNRPKSFGNQDSATNDPSGRSCRLPPAPEGVGIRLESL